MIAHQIDDCDLMVCIDVELGQITGTPICWVGLYAWFDKIDQWLCMSPMDEAVADWDMARARAFALWQSMADDLAEESREEVAMYAYIMIDPGELAEAQGMKRQHLNPENGEYVEIG